MLGSVSTLKCKDLELEQEGYSSCWEYHGVRCRKLCLLLFGHGFVALLLALAVVSAILQFELQSLQFEFRVLVGVARAHIRVPLGHSLHPSTVCLVRVRASAGPRVCFLDVTSRVRSQRPTFQVVALVLRVCTFLQGVLFLFRVDVYLFLLCLHIQ